ncbi:MAG: exodeoxyribonuclease V subunit alpha [Gammaproteobacteria bacterium]|nr:exodeoxyribonuclease V subunit alpha [Gammaproteobacteria bacterium]
MTANSLRRVPADTSAEHLTTETVLSDQAALLLLLQAWVDQRWLRAVDRSLVRTFARLRPETPPLALISIGLLSHRVGQGHVLLDLQELLADPNGHLSGERDRAPALLSPASLLAGQSIESLQTALKATDLVAEPDQANSTRAPVVLDGQRLFLFRYWQIERRIDQGVMDRLQSTLPADTSRLRTLLGQLFPATADADGPDWQKLACALATRTRFAVITGGPGTGKTTTVLNLLALLQAIAHDPEQGDGRALRIRLAAPTGKAAARLNESIAQKVGELDLSAISNGETIREAIPTRVETLHRLLGNIGDSGRPRHHRDNPLSVDLVVVDEASMVDEEMMANLFEALPPQARLVLVGDKDQLASVEAGAVLGSLCGRAAEGHYTPATVQWLMEATGEVIDSTLTDSDGTPLDQAISMLRQSFRFEAGSGIHALAQAINSGDVEVARATLASGEHNDLHKLLLRSPHDQALETLATAEEALPSFADYLNALSEQRPPADAERHDFDAWAQVVLKAHTRFQMLTALRGGDWGLRAINTRIARALNRAGLLKEEAQRSHWYEGRPVIVTRNDYGLGVMNGDVGITFRLPAEPGKSDSPMVLRVAFPAGDGSDAIHWILPSRLQHCETVFAMTVHKSQGSEFNHVAIVLPDTPSPILTRELIYTGVTRASEHCTLLIGDERVLNDAIGKRLNRATGLFERSGGGQSR